MKTVVFIGCSECQKDLAQLVRAGCGDCWVGTTSCNLSEATNAVCHHWMCESFLFLLHCYKFLPLKSMILWMPQMPSAKQAALGWVGTGPAQSAVLPQRKFEPCPQSSQRFPLTWIKRWGDKENLTLCDLKLRYSKKQKKQTKKPPKKKKTNT